MFHGRRVCRQTLPTVARLASTIGALFLPHSGARYGGTPRMLQSAITLAEQCAATPAPPRRRRQPALVLVWVLRTLSNKPHTFCTTQSFLRSRQEMVPARPDPSGGRFRKQRSCHAQGRAHHRPGVSRSCAKTGDRQRSQLKPSRATACYPRPVRDRVSDNAGGTCWAASLQVLLVHALVGVVRLLRPGV